MLPVVAFLNKQRQSQHDVTLIRYSEHKAASRRTRLLITCSRHCTISCTMQATEPPNEDHGNVVNPLAFPTNSCSESAPLLPNSHEQEERQRGSGISLLAHEPLTSLTKILLIITLFLLLLSSVCLCRVASLQTYLYFLGLCRPICGNAA